MNFLIFSLLICKFLISEAFEWNYDVENKLYWSMNCDFIGNDLKNVQMSGQYCGSSCVATPGCTHFTWTDYLGGTCWMKRNSISKENAIFSNNQACVCGVVGRSSGGRILFIFIYFLLI